MIKYIGSKRRLVPTIVDVVSALPGVRRAWDPFTGTTRVAQGLKGAGLEVLASDLASYSEVLARCYVEADARDIDLVRIRTLLDELAALPGVDGYVTETFCRRARYFQPHNGRRIDAIRPAIDELAADPVEHAILLTSLLEAADRVDSTTGVQMAYLKGWSARSGNELELRTPQLLVGAGAARRGDAELLAREVRDADLVYLDPPYNQHSYHANYHVWETLVRADAPEAYGVACKRVDCRTTKSEFNSRPRAWAAFEQLVGSVDAPYLLVSLSDEGHLDTTRVRELLATRGELGVMDIDHPRYVGARIGIHSPAGARVGTVGHVRNTEHLFLVGDGAERTMRDRAPLVGSAHA